MLVNTFKLLSQTDIYIGKNIITDASFIGACLKLNRRIAIITDSHLVSTWGHELQKTLSLSGIQADLLHFPAGESSKTRSTKEMLENKLFERGYGRDSCFIALGGGTVTDLVGFLAATYCRGVPVIYVPTTLLAMVDASIGGKTGVNTEYGKNLIGTFTQPHSVWMDIQTLSSLPAKEWHNGLVETIKHSLIADAALFKNLQCNTDIFFKLAESKLLELIYRSVMIKKNIVEQDEKEDGIRQWLNLGHTVGHAIEKLENYQISHGEAVAIGILVEGYLAVEKGVLAVEILNSIENILLYYGLTLKTRAFMNLEKFKSALKLDKKAIKQQAKFVLLKSIGQVYQIDKTYTCYVSSDYLESALIWAASKFSSSQIYNSI